MQKYIHLVQIVETEKVAANQLRTQLEDQDTEIERLKAEVRHACVDTHAHTYTPKTYYPEYFNNIKPHFHTACGQLFSSNSHFCIQ